MELAVVLQTHTPVYLAWIKKISYVAYGYSGLVKNEFEGLHIHTTQVIDLPHNLLCTIAMILEQI